MGGVVSGIVGGIGGIISGGKAAGAAAAQAQAQREAAERASQMAQFRPIGITTGFGSSRFTVDDLGRVTEAGYELTPELQTLRNRILGLATGAGQQNTGLSFFDKQANIRQGLGPEGYAPRSPGLFNTLAPQVPEGYSLTDTAPMQPRSADMPRDGFQFAYGPSGDRIEVPLVSQPAPVVGGMVPGSGGLPDAYSIGEQLAPIGAAASSLFGLGGQLLPTSISRTASPEALALQQRYQQAATGLAPTDLSMAASPEAMAYANQLRGISSQVLPTTFDTQQAAQDYFNQQRALLEPSRQAQLSQTRSRLFGTGRGGLGVTTATGGAPTSPELQAYYNAIAQQDAALAAQSTDVARQRRAQDIALGTQLGGTALTTQQQAEDIARQRSLGNLQASLGFGREAIATGLAGEDVARQRFAQDLALGTGLFGTAGQFLGQIPELQTAYLEPLRARLGLASTVEGLGQQPFMLSQELARLQSGANAPAAQMYQTGMNQAAASQYRANAYSPLGSFLSGAGGGGFGSLSGLFGGGGGFTGPGSQAALARGGSEGSLTWRD